MWAPGQRRPGPKKRPSNKGGRKFQPQGGLELKCSAYTTGLPEWVIVSRPARRGAADCLLMDVDDDGKAPTALMCLGHLQRWTSIMLAGLRFKVGIELLVEGTGAAYIDPALRPGQGGCKILSVFVWVLVFTFLLAAEKPCPEWYASNRRGPWRIQPGGTGAG